MALRSKEKKREKGGRMSEEIKGKFRYEQDSKRYHRFKVETDEDIVGTIYVPKAKASMPKKITLEYADKR